MIAALVKKVVEGRHLTAEEAKQAMECMMGGSATPVQIASLLTSLRMKGETIDELLGFAQGMRAQAVPVSTAFADAVDTCGTGGDGGKTFNISTATAFVVAASGIPVVKHGNRAASGKSGSADVLEALGVHIGLKPNEAERLLNQTGLAFLFAQLYHPAMKHVMPTRKELGFRTFFNLLGPLCNPAGVKVQLVGVYDAALTEPVAHVLMRLGIRRAMVVAGRDGLDELTNTAETQVSELRDGRVETYEVTPEAIGLPRVANEEIAGGTPEKNATLIQGIFDGRIEGGARDIVALNAGAVIYLAGKAASLADGVKEALRVIASGAAMRKLDEVIRLSQEVAHVS
ncbi:anthranilate phosphoribosyltransferase [Laceyella putida]|uniref:Anthranilate phosphoribosyltransferase n=1 Tax=Laceyella putida TaxID=110101 RepID=A0ABW2RM18_9BACL